MIVLVTILTVCHEGANRPHHAAINLQCCDNRHDGGGDELHICCHLSLHIAEIQFHHLLIVRGADNNTYVSLNYTAISLYYYKAAP